MRSVLVALILLGFNFPTFSDHDSTEWIDAPILEIELKNLEQGKLNIYEWAGLPIFVLKPTKEQLLELEQFDISKLGLNDIDEEIELTSIKLPYNGMEQVVFDNIMLSKRFDHKVIILIGLSPYYGCAVYYNRDLGGDKPPINNFFTNPCRQNMVFDIRGRIIKGHNFSYQRNMRIPPYTISKGKVKIGNQFKVTKNDILKLLDTYKVKAIKSEHDFFRAIALGKKELIQNYLQTHPDLSKEIQGTYGRGTPFLHAVMLNHYDIAALFDKGPKFEQMTSSGNQFGCAMQYRSDDKLQRLFDLGLDPNAGYCKYRVKNCSMPSLYEYVASRPSEQDLESKVLLSLKNGFDINKKHCGLNFQEYMKKHDLEATYNKVIINTN